MMYTQELEVDMSRGGMIIYQGGMFKVKLETDVRFHSSDGGVTT
jgi:hypothetical protein